MAVPVSSLSVRAARSRRPSWDFPRTPSVTRVMVEVAQGLGLDPKATLAGSGIKEPDLTSADLEIDAVQEVAVIRNLVRHFEDRPGLGVAVGRRITLGMSGLWGLMMLTSATATEMITKSHRHDEVSWLFLRPSLEEHDDELHIVYDAGEVPCDVRSFLVERDLVSTCSVMPALVGFGPETVRFNTTLNENRGYALRDALQPSCVEFGCETNYIVLDRALAEHPLPNADPHVHTASERYCEQLATSRRQSLASRVRKAMLEHLDNIPPAAELATSWQMDERTLRRHLAAEGTSYRELARDVRMTRGIDLLEQGMTVERVSERLGFRDPASFSRAFRRWSGVTPGSARARERGCRPSP